MKITRKILIAACIFALLLIVFVLDNKTPAKADGSGKAAAPVTAAPKPQGGQTAPPVQGEPEDSVPIRAQDEPEDSVPIRAQDEPEDSTPLPAQDPPKEGPAPSSASPEQTVPTAAEETEDKKGAYTCTISIRCETLLDNKEALDAEKRELLPEDGVILSEVEATFYEGESAFDVLRRETKRAKIHMEYVDTPIYNSAYIEGIANLYEFDCGEGSGWMYKVDGWFPNYGSSRYTLDDKEVVEWVYTCDFGKDVGGGYAAGQQRG